MKALLPWEISTNPKNPGFQAINIPDVEIWSHANTAGTIPPAKGIPNIWAVGHIFEDYITSNESKDLLIYWLKGLFVGLLSFHSFDLRDFPGLKKILEDHRGNELKNLGYLKYLADDGKAHIVAVEYEPTLFFPAAHFSFWPNQTVTFGNSAEKQMKQRIDDIFDANLDFQGNFVKALTDLCNALPNDKPNPAWWQVLSQYIGNNQAQYNPLPTIPTSICTIAGLEFDVYQPGIVDVNTLQDNDYLSMGIIVIDITQENKKYYAWKPDKQYELPSLFKVNIRITREERQGTITLSQYGNIIHTIYNVEWLTLDDLVLDRIYKINDDRDTYQADYPIRGKYLHLLEKCTHIGNIYELKLKGIQKPIKLNIGTEVQIVDKTNEILPNLFIFPNFRITNWNTYYVYFTNKDPQKYQIRFFSKGGNGIYEGKDLSIGATQVKKYPDYFELLENGKGCGIYKFDINQIPELINLRRDSVDIAIDFGTSNTCLAHLHNDHSELIELKSNKANQYRVFDSSAFDASHTSFFNDQNLFIPSELLIKGNTNDWAKGPEIASIPGVNANPNFDEVSENLKWSDDINQIRAYLYNLFYQYISNLIFEKNIDLIRLDIHYSYPLAFDQVRKKNYSQAINDVLSQLNTQTGINFQHQISAYAESAVSPMAAGDAGADHLIIDIGGGTTDIAYYQNTDVVMSESIKFGGNDILEAMIEGKAITTRTLYEIKQLIRNDNWPKVQSKNVDDMNTANRICAEFRSVILEYVRKMRKAIYGNDKPGVNNQMNQTLKVHRSGNGWYFLADITNDLQNYFEETEVIDVNSKWYADQGTDAKTALVSQMLVIGRAGIVNVQNLERISSFSGINLTINDTRGMIVNKISWKDRIPLHVDYDYTNNRVAIDFSEDEENLNEAGILWQLMQNDIKNSHTIISKIWKDCYPKIQDINGNYFLERSPLVRLIETEIKEKLGRNQDA
jgi:hypothetical protein